MHKFDQLPGELIWSICAHLCRNQKGDLSSVGQLSTLNKRFKRSVNNFTTHLRFKRQIFLLNDGDCLFQKILSVFSNVHSLDMSLHYDNLKIETLAMVFQQCPNLRAIDLRGSRGHHLHLHRLQSLMTFDLPSENGVSMPLIKSFKARYLTDSDLSVILSIFPNLEDLWLEECQWMSNCSGITNLQSIQRLRITNHPHLPKTTVHEISLLPRLSQLDLSSTSLDDEGMQIIATNMLNLSNLILSGCKLSDLGISFICQSKVGPNIRSLDISYCKQLTDCSLFHIASKLKYLQFLNLRSCLQITDKGIDNISLMNIYLLHLDLSNCFQVTDTGIKFLCHRCQYLKNLNVSGSNVSDEGMLYLSESKNKIQKIQIYSCGKVTKKGLEYLSKGCSSSLICM
eukprot:TRINITY_DN6906_c0_g1_i2.p1 TRINITY_DN6906_c0_g1~~TRINITY_DN6906_c0_g1_i2.p1  ORF type:complete len:398 (+),score=27.81 TRINITY_DN6906_c0_g1_i2:176-1369(+)